MSSAEVSLAVDGMTWEPLEHLGEHKSKVASLDKKVEVQLDRHRYLVQESLAKQLTAKKIKDRTACYLKKVVVPSGHKERWWKPVSSPAAPRSPRLFGEL